MTHGDNYGYSLSGHGGSDDQGDSSKRINRFDMAPPATAAAATGQIPGTAPAIPGIFPDMFPFTTGQVGALPVMPLQEMTQQATRFARRVYVGGLSPTANEQSVATFFSHVMSAIGGNTAGPGDAVVNVYINHVKMFAFVEMRSVEEASNAMALDGIIFEGAPVKVRRPSDYDPSLAATLGPSHPNSNLNLGAVGLTPGPAGGLEGTDRIFVGGIPYYFTELQIRQLLESFGPLRDFDLVKDRETGNSKGYAYCVYQDLTVTDIACAALNGIQMGHNTLTIKRANKGTTQSVAGQIPVTAPAIPGISPNMFPLTSGRFGALPVMPVQAMTQQATRHARRVYVGGLSPTANEQSVATFFSHVMSAIGGNTAGPGDAVINVYINHEKTFAFVEMRSVEEASNAMALDGIIFEGAPVKVRRPSDYNPALAATLGPSQPNSNLNLGAVGLTPGPAGGLEGPDCIFVGGLPNYFTEPQIREMLESFGPLRGFDLVKDRETGNSKGYAYCVYQDLTVTDIACAALNGIKMGHNTLTVKRANKGTTQSVLAGQVPVTSPAIPGISPNPNLNLGVVGLPSAGGLEGPDRIFVAGLPYYVAERRIREMQESFAQMSLQGSTQPKPEQETVLLHGQQQIALQRLMLQSLSVGTKVLCLTQVVTVEDLRDDEDYEDILEDMRTECEKFGDLVNVVIPRPNLNGEPSPGVGKVFLEYVDVESAVKARAGLNGRKFDGNQVVAVFYPENKFLQQEYDG